MWQGNCMLTSIESICLDNCRWMLRLDTAENGWCGRNRSKFHNLIPTEKDFIYSNRGYPWGLSVFFADFCSLFVPFYLQPSMIRTTSRPIFVVVSCGCCFLQSCIAFGILLPILYSRKCSVTFLKMQFCTATSTAMAIFTLGFSKLLPEVSWS